MNFTRQYRRFVLKIKQEGKSGSQSESVEKLCRKIEKATDKLRSECGGSNINEGEDADDIRFSDKVLGDVKRFIAVMLFTVLKFYQFPQNVGQMPEASGKVIS